MSAAPFCGFLQVSLTPSDYRRSLFCAKPFLCLILRWTAFLYSVDSSMGRDEGNQMQVIFQTAYTLLHREKRRHIEVSKEHAMDQSKRPMNAVLRMIRLKI